MVFSSSVSRPRAGQARGRSGRAARRSRRRPRLRSRRGVHRCGRCARPGGSPARWPRACCDAAGRRWRSGRSARAASSACSAEFAWMVLRLPRWPVFSACSRSNASAPRTSPTRIRSGRCRSVARSRSAIVTGGQRRFLPERRLRAPCLEAHQVRLRRSNLGRLLDQHDRGRRRECVAASALSSVVFPVPVPPEIRMFWWLATASVEMRRDCGRQRADVDEVVEAVAVRELPDGQRRARRPSTAGTSRRRASRPRAARRAAAAPRRSRRRRPARCS